MMEEVHSIFAAGAGAVTKLVAKDRSIIKRVAMPKYPYEYLSDEYFERVSKEREGLIAEFAKDNL
jgi:oxygen-independent coproporphyrinogen-3 oxidase